MSLTKYFTTRLRKPRAHPVAVEPARAMNPGFAPLQLSEECNRALQMQPPRRVLEILNDLNLRGLRLTSMAGYEEEDERARVQGVGMEIGPV